MRAPSTYYRLALGVAVATVLFLFVAIGALGIIGDGGREDRIYLAVFVVAAIGAVVARLRSAGMALALAVTALAQAVVAMGALIAYHDEAGVSVVDVVAINAMYVALFGLSAWLFSGAAEEPVATD